MSTVIYKNYTNPLNQELNMTFNFHHLKVDYKNKEKCLFLLIKQAFFGLLI